MDDADIASRFEQAERNALLARTARPTPNSPSATHCEECGDPIPEPRRRAMPGCSLCVECQAEAEGGVWP